jgi:NADH-quinone oxidoreductase subunit J
LNHESESSKLQTPNSREIPSSKFQKHPEDRRKLAGSLPAATKWGGRQRFWSLGFGASLELGVWSLELLNMQDTLFYIFAFLTLVFGFLVIANPFSLNPVTSAMFLVLTIASLAGLFVLLHAFFLAAVQVLVYAGAVIVLFLFVIMLLDLKAEERRKIKKAGLVAGVVSVGAILAIFLKGLANSALGVEQAPALDGGTIPLGKLLFTKYLLPFEIVSVLLLVAMVGVVLLSKKDLK